MRPASYSDETSNLDASIAGASENGVATQYRPTQASIGRQDFANKNISQQEPLLNNTDTSGHGIEHEHREDDTQEEQKEKPQRRSILPRPSSIARRTAFIDEDEALPTSPPPAKAGPVSWKDLPNKKQLAILTMARLSEPLTQTSLQAYMFYQLKSFNPNLSDSTISSQAGILQGSFTAAQFVTAILWGRMADNERVGRKRVLLIGLFGTCVSCIGFGFSISFWQAAVFRTAGGALNGNVGVMRTMISEIIKEKRFQSRAFLLLPMCFNIGVIIGPILGGLLSDPVGSYPKVFGVDSVFGGKEGVQWLKHWPYALPNLMSAFFLLISAIGVIFGLEETLESIRDRPDFGLRLGRSIASLFHSRRHQYTAVNTEDTLDSPSNSSWPDSYELESRMPKTSTPPRKPKIKRLPFSRMWTTNVLCTLLCHGILAMHVGTFNNLWFIHLSTPRFDPEHPQPPRHTHQTLPFGFTGGLGMPPRSVGFAMAVLGVIGISLQLFVYPRVNERLGTVGSFRYSLCLFPIAYILAPYLSVIPSSKPPPTQASGVLVWLALSGVLCIQVIARTFALPAAIILINNCSPHPSVLGTIHGISQSVSSFSRTIGPVVGGWGFGKGLQIGVVGTVWWSLAALACLGWCASSLVREGSGHEIFLEGEKEEEEEGKEIQNGDENREERRTAAQGNRLGCIRDTTQAAPR